MYPSGGGRGIGIYLNFGYWPNTDSSEEDGTFIAGNIAEIYPSDPAINLHFDDVGIAETRFPLRFYDVA